MPPEDLSQRRMIIAIVLMAVFGLLFLGAALVTARAHPASTVAGQPLDIVYPGSCCNSAATSPTGDCAPIDDRYVTERADGYHINIPIGGHPKLKTKGYVGIVPFADVKKPISNDYHICLSENGAFRFCFFPKPGTS